MIFVFVEDGSLEIIADIKEAQRKYDGLDVESGVFQFFDESGVYLKPKFTKPNRMGRFLGIFKWSKSGEFELVPLLETDENIDVYLTETNELKSNRWFSDLQEVRQFLTKKAN